MLYILIAISLFISINYLKSARESQKMQKVRIRATRTPLRRKR